MEGCGLWCAAACLDVNWLWWQWVPCRYSATRRSGVSPKHLRPVILPVSLKVNAVDQHGRKSGPQPLTMVLGQVYHSDLCMKHKGLRWRRWEAEKKWGKFGTGMLIQTLPPPPVVFNSTKFWTHVWDDRCVFRLTLGSCHWHRHEWENQERELAIKWAKSALMDVDGNENQAG